jgi:predicted esterase
MTRLALHCVVVTALALSTTAMAQDSGLQKSNVTEVPVTRADLGWAYLRLERAYFANQPTDNERVAQLNQDFDTATKKFFSGKFAETIEEVNQLTESLVATGRDNSQSIALSLKPTVTPALVQLDRPEPIQIRLTSIYPVEVETGTSLNLSLIPVAGGDEVVSVPVSIGKRGDGKIDTTVVLEQSTKLPAGGYSIVLRDGNGSRVDIGMLNVVASSLNRVRQQNEQRLDGIETEQANVRSAIQACRDRNGLLQDKPSSESSSQFLTDLNQLVKQVSQEITLLENGKDPYYRRTGDYWRTFTAGEKDKPVPSRIYAPEEVAGDQPVPLVIALHGAGGDENMFFAGYGAGMIKQLADQHGFLVASPSTTAVGGRTERFDTLIEELAADYSIDPDAVYLIGHSMGGFTTASLAAKRHSKIAAACCLAGGGKPPSDTIPPMLIIAGKLDSVVPMAMLKPMAQQAIDAGMPVEFRQKEHFGHTLMVGAVLPEAINWLLEHRRGSPDRAE